MLQLRPFSYFPRFSTVSGLMQDLMASRFMVHTAT